MIMIFKNLVKVSFFWFVFLERQKNECYSKQKFDFVIPRNNEWRNGSAMRSIKHEVSRMNGLKEFPRNELDFLSDVGKVYPERSRGVLYLSDWARRSQDKMKGRIERIGLTHSVHWTQMGGPAKTSSLRLTTFSFVCLYTSSHHTIKRKSLPISWETFAVWTGLEPATPCVTGMYSNQLNYQTVASKRACPPKKLFP